MFEEMSIEELVLHCMDKFCCIEVCEVIGCEETCRDADCPLFTLFERVMKKKRTEDGK